MAPTTKRTSSWICIAALVALAMAACSSGSSLNLNARTTSAAGDGGDTADAGTGDAGISLCSELLVDRVRVVVRRIDLERASIAADAGQDGGADAGADAGMDAGMDAGEDHGDAGVISCDCPDGSSACVKPGGHVHIGPFLVDVVGGDLAGGIHQVFDVEVPAGTYEDVRFAINTLSRHQADGDGGLSEMKDLHASIAVEGLFGDSRFLFKTPMHLQQKQKGPFVVGPGAKSIVLTLDPRSWFIGDRGQPLDPTDPRNRGRILASIRCSVRMSSEGKDAEGRSFRRDFDDDDGDDRCREDDDGEGEHDDLVLGSDDRHGGGHGDDDHHRAKCSPTPDLVCGDAGLPAPDGGTDAGVDAGMDGG